MEVNFTSKQSTATPFYTLYFGGLDVVKYDIVWYTITKLHVINIIRRDAA